MANGKILITGKPGSPGVIIATVRVVNSHPEKFAQVKPGEVIIAERTEPKDEPYMAKAAAIVTDLGGVTSHTAITCKKLKIPAVVGTLEATAKFKDGQKVVVDGTKGIVYEYIPEAGAPAVPAAGMSTLDKMIAAAKAAGKPLSPAFIEAMRKKGM